MSLKKQTKKIALSWSGGKDAAYALGQLLNNEQYEVVVLLTTFHSSTDRSSMHGHVPEIIREQVKQIGIPLFEIWIDGHGGKNYASKMQQSLDQLQNDYKIEGVAFGDLFLEDVKNYRLKNMASTGLECIFPIWGNSTEQVAKNLIKEGYQTKICCTTQPTVDAKWLGKDFSEKFIQENSNIDPCGENGEFHTFVYSAPYFKNSLSLRLGEQKYIPVPDKFKKEYGVEGHWYTDILIDT